MFSTNIVQTYDSSQSRPMHNAMHQMNPMDVIMPSQMNPISTTATINGIPITQVSAESSLEAKLALSERTCEIYRHQIRYMQDQTQNLRIVVQDKENVIDNLILRFDLGDIPAVEQGDDELDSGDLDAEELRKKSDALAQRTMLENFELREMLTDLRDDNFQLRHEVFELNDRLNRAKLQLANVTAKLQTQGDRNGDGSLPTKSLPPKKHNRDDSNPVPNLGFVNDDDLESNEEDAIDDPRAVAKRKERERRESIKETDLFGPAMTQEAIAKRAERAAKQHRRESSAKVPSSLLPLDNDSDEEDGGKKRRGSVEDVDHANTDDAKAIRQQRFEKHHNRKSSVPTPNIWKDENDGDDDSSEEDRPNKRRGSVTDLANTPEARAKRAEREAKAHRRDSSAAVPNIFGDAGDALVDSGYAGGRRDSYIDPSNTEEARRIRAEREARHRRDSSAATPNIFDDNTMDIINKKSEHAESDEPGDPSMTAEAIAIRDARQQARNHRRDSSNAVPEIFAADYDERLEKQQQRAQRANRDSIVTPNIFDEDPTQTAQAIEIREARALQHHKRGSSIPTPNIFADDAEQRLEIQQRRAAKRRESFTTPNLFAEDADDAMARRADRKRQSMTMPADFFDVDPRNTPEATAKRKVRERKANAQRDSLVTPSIFQNDPSMTPEAIRKRLERQARQHHRKLSSQAPPNMFGGVDSDEDEKIATKHARRQSREVLMRIAGDAKHFSDPETETAAKKQRVEYDLRRKVRKKRKARKKREQTKAQALEDSHHRRESTIPIPNLNFDSDSDDEKFKSNEDKMKISALEIELERFVEKANQLQRELDAQRIGGPRPAATIASGPLGDDYDPNEDLIMSATTTTGGGPDDMMMTEIQVLYHRAVDSKMRLLESTSSEINRLNHVIGVLLKVFNVKWDAVRNLVDGYETQQKNSTNRR